MIGKIVGFAAGFWALYFAFHAGKPKLTDAQRKLQLVDTPYGKAYETYDGWILTLSPYPALEPKFIPQRDLAEAISRGYVLTSPAAASAAVKGHR